MLKKKINKCSQYFLEKKTFGAILFLRREILIFVEDAVSFLSCLIEGFLLTISPYKMIVFSFTLPTFLSPLYQPVVQPY